MTRTATRRLKDSCQRKVRHETESSARAHAHSLLTSYGDHGVRAYNCTLCGGWHVGHPSAVARECISCVRPRREGSQWCEEHVRGHAAVKMVGFLRRLVR